MKVSHRISLFVSILALMALAGCTLPFGGPEPTATATATPTEAPTPTATTRPTLTPPPTRTPNLAATQAYEDMAADVQGYYDNGYIESTNGSYYPLDEFFADWAQIGWYSWQQTGYDPADFVLQAHFSWETDTSTPNPSGCGIVFRLQNDGAHYVIFVTTDGYLHFGVNDAYFQFSGGQGYYAPAATGGEADFAMTVSGSTFNMFIDGEHVKTYYGRTNDWLEGDLAYTILSGTNAGFGTRCEITNSELWVLEP
ncbi:MAG: hypothetical protein JXB85_07795 [Anaerolineales bacterium]|nr:hypothetical protein [Anaerolineales bacterium]